METENKMTRSEVESFFSTDDCFFVLMRCLVGNQKIQFIKELRDLTGNDLVSCKETTDKIWEQFEGAFEESRKIAREMARKDLRAAFAGLADMLR